MKYNKGYVLIECVLSLSLLSIICSAIIVILNDCNKVNLNTKNNIEMMSILNEEINIYKDKIGRGEIQDNIRITEDVDKYKVNISIEQDENLKYAYFIDANINYGEEILEIKTYETKQ